MPDYASHFLVTQHIDKYDGISYERTKCEGVQVDRGEVAFIPSFSAAVSTLVVGYDTVALISDGRHYLAPRECKFGEAMEAEHERLVVLAGAQNVVCQVMGWDVGLCDPGGERKWWVGSCHAAKLVEISKEDERCSNCSYIYTKLVEASGVISGNEG